MALAAMTVPARRWSTRADLILHLSKAETYLLEGPLDGSSISKAATEAGLSRHHFLRLFHEVYGVTPQQVIDRRRLEEAKKLLADLNRSVLEVAVEVGFTNASAFSRFFRRGAGASPSAFRKLDLAT